MKQITNYISETERILSIDDYIQEAFKVGSKTKISTDTYHPKGQKELMEIIGNRIKEEKDNIDFNDIDTSHITIMEGVFAYQSDITKIDISSWDVSNVTSMMEMFIGCKKLESIGDISKWEINKLVDITGMFYGCSKLTNTGDLNKWDVSGITKKQNAFSQANEYIIPKWA